MQRLPTTGWRKGESATAQPSHCQPTAVCGRGSGRGVPPEFAEGLHCLFAESVLILLSKGTRYAKSAAQSNKGDS